MRHTDSDVPACAPPCAETTRLDKQRVEPARAQAPTEEHPTSDEGAMGDRQWVLGFHQPPFHSVYHLHMHCIAPPVCAHPYAHADAHKALPPPPASRPPALPLHTLLSKPRYVCLCLAVYTGAGVVAVCSRDTVVRDCTTRHSPSAALDAGKQRARPPA